MVGDQKAIVAILTNKDKYKICDMAYQIKKLCIFFSFMAALCCRRASCREYFLPLRLQRLEL